MTTTATRPIDQDKSARLIQVNNWMPHTMSFYKRGPSPGDGTPGEVLYDIELKMGENLIDRDAWEKFRAATKSDERIEQMLDRNWVTTGALSYYVRGDLYDKITGPMDRSLIRKLSAKSRRIADDQLFDAKNQRAGDIFEARARHVSADAAAQAELADLRAELDELRALLRPAGDADLGDGIVEED